ncbi:hypothetical protein KF840_09570 [bacterium]|nr:hypothetical protein [bacterium]
MRFRRTIAALALVLAGCAAKVAPGVLQQWQARQLYTCCNIHYENPADVVDANYQVGALLPFGSPATVTGMTARSVSFRAADVNVTLTQAYGTEQETSQQFFAKVLVEIDPHARFATFSPSVQAAIRDGRVERGMTREQVLMSLGYPPTHRTPSTSADTWVYWRNRWVTFEVKFGADGQVSAIIGGAPSNNEPVQQAVAAAPTPAPAKKRKR